MIGRGLQPTELITYAENVTGNGRRTAESVNWNRFQFRRKTNKDYLPEVEILKKPGKYIEQLAEACYYGYEHLLRTHIIQWEELEYSEKSKWYLAAGEVEVLVKRNIINKFVNLISEGDDE